MQLSLLTIFYDISTHDLLNQSMPLKDIISCGPRGLSYEISLFYSTI